MSPLIIIYMLSKLQFSGLFTCVPLVYDTKLRTQWVLNKYLCNKCYSIKFIYYHIIFQTTKMQKNHYHIKPVLHTLWISNSFFSLLDESTQCKSFYLFLEVMSVLYRCGHFNFPWRLKTIFMPSYADWKRLGL
jgi:hypothetical protein